MHPSTRCLHAGGRGGSARGRLHVGLRLPFVMDQAAAATTPAGAGELRGRRSRGRRAIRCRTPLALTALSTADQGGDRAFGERAVAARLLTGDGAERRARGLRARAGTHLRRPGGHPRRHGCPQRVCLDAPIPPPPGGARRALTRVTLPHREPGRDEAARHPGPHVAPPRRALRGRVLGVAVRAAGTDRRRRKHPAARTRGVALGHPQRSAPRVPRRPPSRQPFATCAAGAEGGRETSSRPLRAGRALKRVVKRRSFSLHSKTGSAVRSAPGLLVCRSSSIVRLRNVGSVSDTSQAGVADGAAQVSLVCDVLFLPARVCMFPRMSDLFV